MQGCTFLLSSPFQHFQLTEFNSSTSLRARTHLIAANELAQHNRLHGVPQPPPLGTVPPGAYRYDKNETRVLLGITNAYKVLFAHQRRLTPFRSLFVRLTLQTLCRLPRLLVVKLSDVSAMAWIVTETRCNSVALLLTEQPISRFVYATMLFTVSGRWYS